MLPNDDEDEGDARSNLSVEGDSCTDTEAGRPGEGKEGEDTDKDDENAVASAGVFISADTALCVPTSSLPAFRAESEGVSSVAGLALPLSPDFSATLLIGGRVLADGRGDLGRPGTRRACDVASDVEMVAGTSGSPKTPMTREKDGATECCGD